MLSRSTATIIICVVAWVLWRSSQLQQYDVKCGREIEARCRQIEFKTDSQSSAWIVPSAFEPEFRFNAGGYRPHFVRWHFSTTRVIDPQFLSFREPHSSQPLYASFYGLLFLDTWKCPRCAKPGHRPRHFTRECSATRVDAWGCGHIGGHVERQTYLLY